VFCGRDVFALDHGQPHRRQAHANDNDVVADVFFSPEAWRHQERRTATTDKSETP